MLPTVVVGAAFLALLPDDWHDTVSAIVIAHVFFNYAVVVRTVSGMWAHLDPRLEDAARVLGASRWRVLREVTLPLLRPAVVAAASIVFLFTFTSFGVVLLLGGPSHPTLEVEIYRQTAQLLDLETAAALAVLQLVFLGVLLWWWSRSQARQAVALRLRPAAETRTRPRTTGQWAYVLANLGVFAALIAVPLARLVERSFATPTATASTGTAPSASLVPAAAASSIRSTAMRTSLGYAVAAAVLAVVLGVWPPWPSPTAGAPGRPSTPG